MLASGGYAVFVLQGSFPHLGFLMLWIIASLAVVILFVIASYNGLVRLRVQADESWSGIDVQLKRRHDLIPNLVETVKGYASHEKETLDRVITARNSAMSAQTPEAKAGAENMLTGALKTVFALSEAYPDLKANQNFMALQKSLEEVEDNLQNARRYYNAVARDLNTKCDTFPSVLIANAFGFKKRIFFEAEASERDNVKVSFNP